MHNTAIFYDIENLVAGYGTGMHERTAAISLADIEARISATAEPALGAYAVKRAYADWSAAGLRPLRRQVIEGGIEARQTFAFGQGGRKNAADIEVVLDAVELVFTRPAITHFVIVSADGGFGALVRTLHEHGKTVTVAGYRERTGNALPAVCDTFVDLPMPTAVALACGGAPPAPASTPATPEATSTRFTSLSAALPPAPAQAAREREAQVAAMREVVGSLVAHDTTATRLADGGISVAALGQVAYGFVDVDAVRRHFGGLLGLVDEAAVGTGATLLREPGRERLVSAPMTAASSQLAA